MEPEIGSKVLSARICTVSVSALSLAPTPAGASLLRSTATIANGLPNQWVGDVRSVLLNVTNGVRLEYMLVGEKKFLWMQSMKDAVTGQLLSTFKKTSGPMLGWGTALGCGDYDRKSCKGTTGGQWYVNSTIVLDSADPTFVQTLGASSGANHTAMETVDKGKTWAIAKIYIPAMQK